MFGEAWPPMSVPDLAPDDGDDECNVTFRQEVTSWIPTVAARFLPVSVYSDRLRQKSWSPRSVPVWQHMQLSDA